MTKHQQPPVPDKLTDEQRNELALWCQKEYPVYWRKGPGGIKSLVQRCFDHYRGIGNRPGYVDWVAVCRNWIRKQHEMEFGSKQREKPQDLGRRGKEGGPLTREMQLILGEKND